MPVYVCVSDSWMQQLNDYRVTRPIWRSLRELATYFQKDSKIPKNRFKFSIVSQLLFPPFKVKTIFLFPPRNFIKSTIYYHYLVIQCKLRPKRTRINNSRTPWLKRPQDVCVPVQKMYAWRDEKSGIIEIVSYNRLSFFL